MWLRCLQLIKDEDVEAAYRLVLTEGDDIYLLRLMVQTGPCSKRLQPETFAEVLHRLNKVSRVAIIPQMHLQWMEDTNLSGKIWRMPDNEVNEHLDTLYQIGKAEWYNKQLKA